MGVKHKQYAALAGKFSHELQITFQWKINTKNVILIKHTVQFRNKAMLANENEYL